MSETPPAIVRPDAKLGAPRIFIEVLRPLEGGPGWLLISRKEIDLQLWLNTSHQGDLCAAEINNALAEVKDAK